MVEDPIVEELHKIREKLLEEHGGLDGYFEHLQALQEELKDRIVTGEPRRPAVINRKISQAQERNGGEK
jgi:hypothetical protein